jgi:hypothetical protein
VPDIVISIIDVAAAGPARSEQVLRSAEPVRNRSSGAANPWHWVGAFALVAGRRRGIRLSSGFGSGEMAGAEFFESPLRRAVADSRRGMSLAKDIGLAAVNAIFAPIGIFLLLGTI